MATLSAGGNDDSPMNHLVLGVLGGAGAMVAVDALMAYRGGVRKRERMLMPTVSRTNGITAFGLAGAFYVFVFVESSNWRPCISARSWLPSVVGVEQKVATDAPARGDVGNTVAGVH